jgi:hypothetical protein
VRVTGQLIHAASDEHVWAKAYDRDLTDIFAIQSELSQAIAAELKAALSPEEKALLDRKPTENAEAYDLYLQARGLERVTEDKRKLSLLEKATTLDPGFAWAWGDLADSYAYNAFTFRENLEESRARAKAAIDRALSIAPEDPEVVESLGTYYYSATTAGPTRSTKSCWPSARTMPGPTTPSASSKGARATGPRRWRTSTAPRASTWPVPSTSAT